MCSGEGRREDLMSLLEWVCDAVHGSRFTLAGGIGWIIHALSSKHILRGCISKMSERFIALTGPPWHVITTCLL
ncbi:hypothetical protein RB213_005158 [Colletotrichum asianum]